jgi:hypothetical protein
MHEDWKWLEKTIVHNQHHAKLAPLPPMPFDVLFYLLGFHDLKQYTFCCHLSLNPNNVHPNPPPLKISSFVTWIFHQLIQFVPQKLIYHDDFHLYHPS